MADIFISYSSKDREKAEQLTELLASAGLSVWIDQAGLEVSNSWSKEIVQAINDCKAFLVLLSPNSLQSHNVIKEVSLASEKRKKILPLELEPITLTDDFEYQLAGIHRTPMMNIDSIIRALGKLVLEATKPPELKLVKETDSRKSLMILPFEDLSPTADNGWFADGIVSELISALSHIKALRIMDVQETKSFKSFRGHLTTYAHEMQIRYFVQGDVRKFGDQIKISSRLLDIETGDHLWQDSHRGTMEDIFDIQEKVAEKVVDGLNLILTSEEKKKLAERGTENVEAYELFLKGHEYFARHTKEGFQVAAQLYSDAIRLDAGYANAYQSKANTLAALCQSYGRDPALLVEAEQLCRESLRMRPDLVYVYAPLSHIYMLQGKRAEAEAASREYIRLKPEDYSGHSSLGYFYYNIGEPAKAIAPLEEAVRLKPDVRTILYNLVIACRAAKEPEKCHKWALMALPIEKRYLKLHPDDDNSRMHYTDLLFFGGRTEDVYEQVKRLKQAKDGFVLHNTACLIADIGDKTEALGIFRKAIEAGYRDIRNLNIFLTDEESLGTLRGTPEWEDAKALVEEIEREEKAKTNG